MERTLEITLGYLLTKGSLTGELTLDDVLNVLNCELYTNPKKGRRNYEDILRASYLGFRAAVESSPHYVDVRASTRFASHSLRAPSSEPCCRILPSTSTAHVNTYCIHT